MGEKDKRKGCLGEPGGCNHTLNLGCLAVIIFVVIVWLSKIGVLG